ncbi:MAG: hypothetical protein BroJett007_20500 [Chloroflexota bacterium]|nr:MAG: hypothetical protein BroJett007_20500 [Chloroflexota bacterium]
MVFGRSTLRLGLYAALITVLLALSNLFVAFESRTVLTAVKDAAGEVVFAGLSFSQFALYIALVAAGFVAARQIATRGVLSALVNGAIAGLIVGAGLALLIVFTEAVDVRFVFRNFQPLSRSALYLGQADAGAAITLLLILSAVLGGVGGLMTQLSARVGRVVLGGISALAIFGVLQSQIDKVMTLSDAVTLALAFGGAYFAVRVSNTHNVRTRLLIGVGVGFGIALIMAGLAAFTGMERGTILRGAGSLEPTLLNLPLQGAFHVGVFALILMLVGAAGAVARDAGRLLHDGAWYLIAITLMLGVLSSQRGFSPITAGVVVAIMCAVLWILPPIAGTPNAQGVGTTSSATSRRTLYLLGLVILLALPGFIGLSLSNTLNLMMIYIIMGVGMNVMIGYAGLLDLGYVASFAIGAYTTGLLTTPSMITCGGITPDEIKNGGLIVSEVCTGLLTFWEAWPIAILVSAFVGMGLGVPVLRLRGDYLAIVTLGFGEIINRLVNSSTFKPLLGGPQGINNIPVPTLNLSFINPAWNSQLASSNEIYYLFLFTVAVGVLVVLRLANTRLGRAWRALRDDEDVAEATGIHLVGAKLLAFGISSAFSGMGGALFGASLQGIYPNSFTLNVSIFVLCLVIVGGMGSIPAVFVGAFVLIGFPEVARELQDYRLLAFGVLLVVAMLSKPEGILPPRPPKLSEHARPKTAPAAGD